MNIVGLVQAVSVLASILYDLYKEYRSARRKEGQED